MVVELVDWEPTVMGGGLGHERGRTSSSGRRMVGLDRNGSRVGGEVSGVGATVAEGG